MPSNVKQYIQISSEYLTVKGVVDHFLKEGIKVKEDCVHTANKTLNEYVLPSLGDQKKWYENTILISAEKSKNIVDSILEKHKNIKEVEVYGDGANHNVSDKEDLVITVNDFYNETFDYKISLKMYASLRKLQTASGTFISLVHGLLFDTTDTVGTYMTPEGETFRTQTFKEKQIYEKYYGEKIATYVREIKNLDSLFMPLKHLNFDEDVWDKVKKVTGEKAAKLVDNIVSHLNEDDFAKFNERFLRRAGITGDDHMVAGTISKNKVIIYNSISDNSFMERMKSYRDGSSKVKFYYAAGSRGGHNCFYDVFDKNEDLILQVEIPFTLNANGNWFNKRNPPEKEGFGPESLGKPRPGKIELTSSINTYIHIKYIYG
jgi:hypothetical protein